MELKKDFESMNNNQFYSFRIWNCSSNFQMEQIFEVLFQTNIKFNLTLFELTTVTF